MGTAVDGLSASLLGSRAVIRDRYQLSFANAGVLFIVVWNGGQWCEQCHRDEAGEIVRCSIEAMTTATDRDASTAHVSVTVTGSDLEQLTRVLS